MDPLLAAVLKNPRDPELRLVYSDWLEERGEIKQARWWRETKQKRPTNCPLGQPYPPRLWQWCEADGQELASPWRLPKVLFFQMRSSRTTHGGGGACPYSNSWYDTEEDGMRAFAEAIKELSRALNWRSK